MSKLTQSTPFFEEVGAIPPAPRVFAGSLKVPPCILWIITAGYLAVHALPGIHALFLATSFDSFFAASAAVSLSRLMS